MLHGAEVNSLSSKIWYQISKHLSKTQKVSKQLSGYHKSIKITGDTL